MQWRTRPRPGDTEAVRKLVAGTGFFSAEETDVAVELVEEALSKGPASGYEFLFADTPGDPDTLLGYTCYGAIPATESSFDLYWIAVATATQRSGLGRKLLNESERLSKERGARQMFVDTSGRGLYAPTRAFYERMGYHVAAELEDFYAPGDAKIVYAKRL